MSTEYKGHIIRDKRPDGEMLKNRPIGEGDVLKSEGAKGDPLWIDDKLNEAGKKKKKLNEDNYTEQNEYKTRKFSEDVHSGLCQCGRGSHITSLTDK